MIYATATTPVNPAGEPPLTRAQIWKGLQLKARDALSARARFKPKLRTPKNPALMATRSASRWRRRS